MNSLINIAAILVFAFLVFGAVALALRFLIPAEPHHAERPQGSRGRLRMLADLLGMLAVLGLVLLATEVRLAYGSPFGERAHTDVEVLEVGECERSAFGFGLVRSCRLDSYRHLSSNRVPNRWDEMIEVVADEPPRPGDRVAQYSSSGWTDFVFLGSGGSRWQPVSAEGRPNLVWLPTATLIAATAMLIALQRRVTTRARKRSNVAVDRVVDAEP